MSHQTIGSPQSHDGATNAELDTVALRNTNFDAKRWLSRVINERISSSANFDADLGKLLMQLQLHAQEKSSALDDLAAQSLTRLPRASIEIGRVASETNDLSKQLAQIVDETRHVCKEGAEASSRIQELHSVRQRLVKCRGVLDEARLLAANVESVEQRIVQLDAGGTGCDIESLASDISKMQISLATLQGIDTEYGAALKQKVEGFEHRLQRALEKECTDAIDRRDTARAPTLVSTLAKIGRANPVLQRYLAGLVASKKERFMTEIVNKKGHGQLSHNLRRYNAQLLKFLLKEREYLSTLLSSSSSSHNSSLQSETASPRKMEVNLLTQILESVNPALKEALTQCVTVMTVDNNNDIVDSFLAQEELIESYREEISRSVIQNPFEAIVPQFLTNERTLLMNTVNANSFAITSSVAGPVFDARAFNGLAELIDNSAKRCSIFFASKTLRPAATHWNNALISLSKNFVAIAEKSQSVTRDAIRTLLAFLASLEQLPQLCESLEATLQKRLHGMSLPNPLLCDGTVALSGVTGQVRSKIQQSIVHPIGLMLKEYCNPSNGVWSTQKSTKIGKHSAITAAQAVQTDLALKIGGWVMELPSLFESLGIDTLDLGSWLTDSVDALRKEYVDQVNGTLLVPRTKPEEELSKQSFDQLLADVEYLENVMHSVTETGDALLSVRRRIEELTSAGTE